MGSSINGAGMDHGSGCWIFLFGAPTVRVAYLARRGIDADTLERRKNALSMIYLSMMTLAVVSFQVSPLPRFYNCSTYGSVVLLGLLPHVQRYRK